MKTHRERVIQHLGLRDEPHSLPELASASGVPLHILEEVKSRGEGAYYSGGKHGHPSPSVRLAGSYRKGVDAPVSKKLSMAQWSMARVYSFLDTYRSKHLKHDFDLARLL
jgi:hypothetical protein